MAEPSLVNRLTEWAVTAQQSHPGAQQCTSTTGGRVRQKYSKGAAVTQFWPVQRESTIFRKFFQCFFGFCSLMVHPIE